MLFLWVNNLWLAQLMVWRQTGDKPSSEPMMVWVTVASFTEEGNLRLAKHPLKTNGRIANLEFTSSVKEATHYQCFTLAQWV